MVSPGETPVQQSLAARLGNRFLIMFTRPETFGSVDHWILPADWGCLPQ